MTMELTLNNGVTMPALGLGVFQSDLKQTTAAVETALTAADGRVRAIGVSNFMPHRLLQLLNSTAVVPAVNQIELHPYFTQPDVQAGERFAMAIPEV
jgi:diketogulonate reductase-like aldo/keto reductase